MIFHSDMHIWLSIPFRNEAGPKQLQLQQANGAGFTAYDTMAV